MTSHDGGSDAETIVLDGREAVWLTLSLGGDSLPEGEEKERGSNGTDVIRHRQ